MFDKKRILKNGEPGEATVLSVDQRSHITSNELRDYDYVLDVRPATSEPFQANVRAKFWMVGLRPKTGEVLKVRIAQKSREVVFDLAGDPRYDVDAMNAQTEAGWAHPRAAGRRALSRSGGGAARGPARDAGAQGRPRSAGAVGEAPRRGRAHP